MAAMTSRFNIRCVIQYYSDQWFEHTYSESQLSQMQVPNDLISFFNLIIVDPHAEPTFNRKP